MRQISHRVYRLIDITAVRLFLLAVLVYGAPPVAIVHVGGGLVLYYIYTCREKEVLCAQCGQDIVFAKVNFLHCGKKLAFSPGPRLFQLTENGAGLGMRLAKAIKLARE